MTNDSDFMYQTIDVGDIVLYYQSINTLSFGRVIKTMKTLVEIKPLKPGRTATAKRKYKAVMKLTEEHLEIYHTGRFFEGK